jgi:hypothetical protein
MRNGKGQEGVVCTQPPLVPSRLYAHKWVVGGGRNTKGKMISGSGGAECVPHEKSRDRQLRAVPQVPQTGVREAGGGRQVRQW